MDNKDNYIVSARKYRPKTFASVVGQEALTTTLRNAVKSRKLAHAYLFCGPRGVGKTTCARIFAKAINCEHPTDDGEACIECNSCKAFNEGRSMNIFELDAASNNSVENIKSLMEQTQIPPQTGRYKVFIIDEVHMLSTAAFNAFLKTLEEPPQYVIFILATTEKNKILPTILSRCQIFDFERMTVPKIINHLEMVAKREGITYEEEALNVIAEKADGGMRDALSIFDQVTSFCQGHITYQKVLQDLNVLDADNYFKIVDLALTNKVSDIMVLLDSIIARGFDGSNIINGLAVHVRNVMMAKNPETLPLLEVSDQQRQRYEQQAKTAPLPFLYKTLRILNECDVNYRQSSNKRLLVELTLIRVAQITQPEDADDAGAGRSPMRLKSLFKHQNVIQPNKPAMQVAGAGARLARSSESVHAQHAQNDRQEENSPANIPSTAPADSQPAMQATASQNAPSATPHTGRVRFAIKDIGPTFASLRKQKQEHSYADAIQVDEKEVEKEKVEKPEEKFSDGDLMQQWILMCNRMPQRYVGLAARLKNLVPHITNYPNFEVVVDNQLILDQIMGIRKNIRATMRLKLRNTKIEFMPRLAQQDETKRALTRTELFRALCEQNKDIDRLRKELGLELV